MKSHGHKKAGSRHDEGQVLLMFALFILVLIPFVGLGVDCGFAYITKARLSKAVDAAALAGMANYRQGNEAFAQNMAISTFKANYGTSGRDAAPVNPTVTLSTDATGNKSVQVSATTTINTFFIRVLPGWQTLTVGDTAQATRANLIMTLVLDRSDSMDPTQPLGGAYTQGGKYLPGAVSQFISVFDDNADKAAVVSFASSVTNEVPMSQPFRAKVTTAVNNLVWSGGTFAHGGLTNAFAIENANNPPANQNAVKVVVFFTDGQANMIQNNLTCPDGGASKPWNFGGSSGGVSFFATNTPITSAAQANDFCAIPSCCNGRTFPSITGGSVTINPANVIRDAMNRCIQVSDSMRTNGIYVYAVGLDVGNFSPVTIDFLQEVANDPDSPTFDPNLPIGTAMVAKSGSDLSPVFQQIASDILLRLLK